MTTRQNAMLLQYLTPQCIPKLDPHLSLAQSVFSEPQPQLEAASGRKTNSFLIFNCYPTHCESQAVLLGENKICILQEKLKNRSQFYIS